MARVLIYTTQFCGFSIAAKALLDEKNVEYFEVDVEDPKKRQMMVQRTKGHYTVPQVFIDGEYIGGYDKLSALDRDGKLDNLLGI